MQQTGPRSYKHLQEMQTLSAAEAGVHSARKIAALHVLPTEAPLRPHKHPKAQKPKGAAFFDCRVDEGLSALQVTSLWPPRKSAFLPKLLQVRGPGSVLSKPWPQ